MSDRWVTARDPREGEEPEPKACFDQCDRELTADDACAALTATMDRFKETHPEWFTTTNLLARQP